tara:strand:+ start:8205 stop:9329 length:1125 start_codon:yes stop_codon:yes gene_type:complete
MALPNLSGSNIQDTFQRVIHTDGTNVFDGTGSTMPLRFEGNNVYVPGILIADSYIVTQSITSITSGSVIFGNSADDKHVFTGSIDNIGETATEHLFVKPTSERGKPIAIRDGTIYFYSASSDDPKSLLYGDNKEKARIRAVPGSFNLSFEVSGSTGYTSSLYISESNSIGFNTDDPQVGFDVRSDEVQFQQTNKRTGLKINAEGNPESFNNVAAASATGSEFVLNYSRGTTVDANIINAIVGPGTVATDSDAVQYFNNLDVRKQQNILLKAEASGLFSQAAVGDTLGSIRWIAASGSTSGGLDNRVAGEAASIKTVVSDVDNTGVTADMIFNLPFSKENRAQQILLLDHTQQHQLTGSLNVSGNVNATIDGGTF